MKNLILGLTFLLIVSPAWATNYFVSHAGSDENAGTTTTASWRTLAYAEDQLVAGDTVYVKADSAYTDADGANGCVLYVEKIGTALLPITFEGYNATPGDGDDFADGSGRFEIDATGKTYGIAAPVVTNTNRYREFRNCYVRSATSHGIDFSKVYYCWFYNVEASLNGGNGMFFANLARLFNCTANNNGSEGILAASYFYGKELVCKNNTSYNLTSTDYSAVVDSVFSKASGSGAVVRFHAFTVFVNCAFYGSGSSSHGLNRYSPLSYQAMSVQNCIFVNVVKGIELYTGANDNTNFMSNNCFFGVTTPYTNCVSSGGDVLADPLFVDAANGDFHLRAGSPCIGAGVNGQDIGAYGFNGAGVLGLQATE